MVEPLDSYLALALANWSKLGVIFADAPAPEASLQPPVDLERLLLETTLQLPREPQLFTHAANWLHVCGDLVARHRLSRLVHAELPRENHPTLGLLLDTAQESTYPPRFNSIIARFKPLEKRHPLFDIDRATHSATNRLRHQSSPISRRWNLLVRRTTFDPSALRPSSWLMAHQPSLRIQADLRGDLRASVLASLKFDDGAGESETALAQMTGGSRSQVRNALENLLLTGRVFRKKTSHPTIRTIHLAK